MTVRLTLACGDYDRTRALKEGRVPLEGVAIDYVALEPEELFFRQLRYQEFHVSELSLGNYIILQSRGDNPFVALPVFPSRHFRHGFIWKNSQSGIETPEDLKGKRVGIPEYHVTAAWWMRDFLASDYRVQATDFEWFLGSLNEPGRHSRLDFKAPSGVRLSHIPETETLNDWLVEGKVDALLAPRYPTAFATGDPRVARLFPDFAAVEQDYYRRTGLFPIMHCVAMRRDVYEAYPWLAVTLTKAFGVSKDLCQAELEAGIGTLPVMLPWLLGDVERARATMGRDFWPYGVEANRRALEQLVAIGYEQGLVERRVGVDELFAPNTLVMPPAS